MNLDSDLATTPGSGAATPRLYALAAFMFLLVWLPSWFGPAGVFIDEAYYLACADHPALGYVDHPPFSIYLLVIARGLLGDSLPAMRLLPSLAAAASVLLTGLLARRMGADAWGQSVAGLAVVAAPLCLVVFGFYSMNAFSLLFWSGIFLLLIEIEQRDEPRLWLAVGALAGVGLQNKHTLVLLVLGLAVGMLATRARRHLLSPFLWSGLGIAALIVVPNIYWQMNHDWASLEFYRQADLVKNIPTPPLDVLLGQINALNPVSLPLWLAGVGFLLVSKRGESLRHLGVLFLVLLGLLIVGQKGRPDRIVAVYPLLFAAGGTLLGVWLQRPGFAWLRVAYPAVLALVGVALAPVSLPLLPPATMAKYTEILGIIPQIEAGEGKQSPLPQWLADRYEWESLLEQVEAAVATLPAAERESVVILGASYGQVAPIAHLGKERGLPPVYAGQNNYHLWGPPPAPMDVAVIIGSGEAGPDGGIEPDVGVHELFAQVELVSVYTCQWCMAWRNDMPIWIARQPRRPIAEVWSDLRAFH